MNNHIDIYINIKHSYETLDEHLDEHSYEYLDEYLD